MPPKQEVDPEILLRQKFLVKCRFRALGRRVLANSYWLIEDIDEYQGVDDVKRRVEQAVRTKAKPKQLLTIKDKALLNKSVGQRTNEEQKYLYRILGDLKCFKKYPHNAKKKLAAATYFQYYGPNRVVIRQGQEAQAMYFIVTGDVTVSHLVYDAFLDKKMSVNIAKLTAGDVFGDVALLHDIPRSATVTTNSHCELLALMKTEFKFVLRTVMQQQWDEVKLAMSAFTYFDRLDDIAKREGCILAKMKTYAPNETLLGDGEGVPNFVYFLLTGRCQMIESLQIFVTKRLGRNFYSLYDPYIPEEESEQDIDKKLLKTYKNKISTLKDVRSESDMVEVPRRFEGKMRGVLKSSNSDGIATESKAARRYSVALPEATSDDLTNDNSSQILLHPTSEVHKRHSIRLSLNSTGSTSQEKNLKNQNAANLQTHFMQVVVFNPGSTFGFGENMRDRRIIALTPVSCLLLPKVWLLQRNTANIWTRVQHYLEEAIPTKKELFKEFKSAQRWREFREQMVSDALANTHAVNFTSVHDVPYSVRMEEGFDI